jgi:hypothetical protein
MSETSSKKRKLSLPLVLAGGVSSLVLALGMSPTFSAFTASIQNTVNTAGTGSLVMEESTTDGTNTTTCKSTDGGSLATNSAICANINKYGGSITMVPGTPVATSVSIKNTGNVAATAFSMAFSTCGPTASSSLCSKMLVEVKSGSTVLTPDNSTAASLAGTTIDIRTMLGLQPIGSAAIPLTITVTLPSATAPANDNAYQGLQISQPITWTFQS